MNSPEYELYQGYLRQKRKERIAVMLTQFIIVIGLIAAWEFAGRMNKIDTLLFSYPSKILRLLYDRLLEGTLLNHVGVTLAETSVGFLLGTVCGTALAAAIWWFRFLSKVLDPFLVVLNSMPKVALGPLIIVAIGPNVVSVIATALAVTVIITTLVVHSSFREVDESYIKVVRIFGATRADVFRKVILPASFPTIVSTLKVNVGLAWIGVVVGEFLVSKQGLGYLIIYGFQVFNFTLVIGSLFIIAIAATLMYQAVAVLEKKLIGHRQN
jgi:NitT/TauT family transport system permease protein